MSRLKSTGSGFVGPYLERSLREYLQGSITSDKIRPNKLRDLHAALDRELTDAEYRVAVEQWLKDVSYAE